MAGTSSSVFARRMGGDAPHLGLVLTEGELAAYSIERDLSRSSNDRGLFLLHPGPLELAPGESTRIGWSIFPCEGPEDFAEQVLARTAFVRTRWDRHVLFPGEEAELEVVTSAPGPISIDGARIVGEVDEVLDAADSGTGSAADSGAPFTPPVGRRTFRAMLAAEAPGEHTVTVRVGMHTARSRLLVKEPLATLLERRTAFLAAHQQYDGSWEPLRGALLAYDTEDQQIFYDRAGDFNGGRERVGMGILLAEQLRALRDRVVVAEDPQLAATLRGALERYAAYVRRELVDVETGSVFDDAASEQPAPRQYNAPWFSRFFLSLWELDGDRADLLTSARIIERFYADGGGEFYPIQLPVLELVAALDAGVCTRRGPACAHSSSPMLGTSPPEAPTTRPSRWSSSSRSSRRPPTSCCRLTCSAATRSCSRRRAPICTCWTSSRACRMITTCTRSRSATGTATGSASASSTVTRCRTTGAA